VVGGGLVMGDLYFLCTWTPNSSSVMRELMLRNAALVDAHVHIALLHKYLQVWRQLELPQGPWRANAPH
jgi:hypothetical protein